MGRLRYQRSHRRSPLEDHLRSLVSILPKGPLSDCIKASIDTAEEVLKEVARATPSSLHSNCVDQVDACLLEARGAFADIKTRLRDYLNQNQRDVSRYIVPTVQRYLKDNYAAASATGRGSGNAKKKRVSFHLPAVGTPLIAF